MCIYHDLVTIIFCGGNASYSVTVVEWLLPSLHIVMVHVCILQVIATIFALGRTVSVVLYSPHISIHKHILQAQKNGYDGPKLGPKEAEGQKRDWTEEELRQGSGFVSLQMGTNKVASQQGMTPYGKQRQIYQS